MTTGERIKELREGLGMSQDELAKKLGYKSRSSINKIELGIYELRPAKIKAIAEALETTPGHIMGWADEDYAELGKKISKDIENNDIIKKIYGEHTSGIVGKLHDLPDEEQAQLDALIRDYRDLNEQGRAAARELIDKILDLCLGKENWREDYGIE